MSETTGSRVDVRSARGYATRRGGRGDARDADHAGGPRARDAPGRSPPALGRAASPRLASRRGAVAALLAATAVMLCGCPIYYDEAEPRTCVAFHECSMGCSEQPCVAAWGCIDGECVPISMPAGAPCYLRGELGVCIDGACEVATYPEPPVVTVQAPAPDATGDMITAWAAAPGVKASP